VGERERGREEKRMKQGEGGRVWERIWRNIQFNNVRVYRIVTVMLCTNNSITHLNDTKTHTPDTHTRRGQMSTTSGTRVAVPRRQTPRERVPSLEDSGG
jgi:hypothetical protein